MRQATRINRAAAAEEGAESRSGARRAIALGMLGAGALVGMAAPAATAATTNPGAATTTTDAGTAASSTSVAPIAATGTDSAAPAASAASDASTATAPTAGIAPAAPTTETSTRERSTAETSTTATTSIVQSRAAKWARIGQIKLYPLAGTSVDPLSNVIGTNLSGLPISTSPVNAVFSDGLPIKDLPVLGGVLDPSASAPAASSAAPAGSGSDSLAE